MKEKKVLIKKIISILIYTIVIPAIIYFWYILFKNKKYNIISILVVLIACIPFFIHFEKGKKTSRELVAIASMSAISVLGRVIFSPIPGFKPITAMVIVTGLAFGGEAGFITGCVSALVSNFFFGQGVWTPFQMFSWGFIGLITGLLFKKDTVPNYFLLFVLGLVGGVLYSALMDIYTVLSADKVFNLRRYLFFVGNSIPFVITYVVSNIFFLFILARPLLRKLNRLKINYKIFE